MTIPGTDPDTKADPYGNHDVCPVGVLIEDSRRHVPRRRHFDQHYRARELSQKEATHYGGFPVGVAPCEILMRERHHYSDRWTNQETREKHAQQQEHALQQMCAHKQQILAQNKKEENFTRNVGKRTIPHTSSTPSFDPLTWHIPEKNNTTLASASASSHHVKSIAELGAALQSIVRSHSKPSSASAPATTSNLGASGRQYDISDLFHPTRHVDPVQQHTIANAGRRGRELPIEYTPGFFLSNSTSDRSWSSTDLRAVRLQARLQRERMANTQSTLNKDVNKNKSYRERQKEQQRAEEINMVSSLPELVSVADDLTCQAVVAPVADTRAARLAAAREKRRAQQNEKMQSQAQALTGGGGSSLSTARSSSSQSINGRRLSESRASNHSLSPTMARADSRSSTSRHQPQPG